MLTTYQLVQNATSLLWPALLILIAWYCVASSLRAGVEFFWRWHQRKKVQKKIKKKVERMSGVRENPDDTVITHLPDPVVQEHLVALENELGETVLLHRKATRPRLLLTGAESILFLVLAIAACFAANPLFQRTLSFFWVHLAGTSFFLCFILKARRLLLLLPLTFMVWFSWEVFTFINSFERTLTATSMLAKVNVLEKQGVGAKTRYKIGLTFRGKTEKILYLSANQKLYFEGKVLRVASEVLLFGGKNLATIDRVFSDEIKSSDAIILVNDEEVPQLYRWKAYSKSFIEELKKKFSYFLWKQLFQLQRSPSARTFVKKQHLAAAICTPMQPGAKFEIRLRHVGGIECHQSAVGKKPTTRPNPDTP